LFNFREKYKIYIWSVLALSIFFIFYAWFKDIFSGEGGRVYKFILRGKRAVESGDILTCTDMISTQYQDKYGNDRQSVILIAKEAFTYYKKIFVHIDSMEIKFDDSKKQADVEIVAMVLGQTQSDNAEKILEGEKGRFRVKLIKEERVWMVSEFEFFEPITVMGQNIS
jgi:hypothetical protein